MQSSVWKSPTVLFVRSALWTILFPGVLAGYIPWRFLGFRRRGRGTLSPVDPPERLVVTGLYRWVRNPMYVGVLSALIGEAFISAEPGLFVYAVGFFTAAQLFILAYEEPVLERSFGSSYTEYKTNVRRWLPRTSPWNSKAGC